MHIDIGRADRGVAPVASGEQRSAHRSRTALDIRGLLRNREFIKTTAYVLPRQTKIQVLEMMERLRRERMDRRSAVPPGQGGALPEMTGGELVREINWRIGTLPPEDAEAVAEYIRQLTRWRSLRRRKGGVHERREPASPRSPGPTR